MEYKDYYKTLGVSKNASAEEIQKSYRKLARKFHPDVNKDPDAEDRFKEISEAYEVLKDKEKRRKYDQLGQAWKSGGGPPPDFEGFHFDFGDGFTQSGFSTFFESLFGGSAQGFGGAGFRNARSRRGARPHQEAKLALTLEEASRGGRRQLQIADPLTGEQKSYDVQLPAGVRAGQRIRLAGGDGRAGRLDGDLYLTVDLKPHPRFRIDGADLHVDLPIAPWEAMLGGEAQVRTLDESVRVRIPESSSSGRKIRLRGKGFPVSKGPNGDLFVHLKVVVPSTLTGTERELAQRLRAVSKFKPRGG